MSATPSHSLDAPSKGSYFPFNKLPLELQRRIVELVDEQDATYRDRIKNAYKPKLGPPLKCYGKGINQLALCSRELGELASACLYSDLNEQLSRSAPCLSWTMFRHRHCFKSVTLTNKKWSDDIHIRVIGQNLSPLMLALPHLPNVTSIMVKEYLKWMSVYSQAYAENPILSIASKVCHLEIDVWAEDSKKPGEDDNILRDQDFIIQLLKPFSHITSLDIACEFISIKMLEAINCLNELKTLKIWTNEINLGGILPETLLWPMGTSLVSATVCHQMGWGPLLFRWIQAFGYQLQDLRIRIRGEDFPAVDPAEKLFDFPSLLHLTITSSPLHWAKILKHFEECPLAHLTFADTFHIWVSARKSPIAKQLLRVDIALMLEEVGKVFADGCTRRKHQEVQSLVKATCERCNLRYRYNSSSLAPTPTLPPHPSEQDRTEWKDSVSPLVAYINRAMDRIAAEGDKFASEEFLRALQGFKDLKQRDEE